MYQGAKGINFTYQKHDKSLDFYKENIKSVIKTFQMQQHFQKQWINLLTTEDLQEASSNLL